MCVWMSGICIYGMIQRESTSELLHMPSPSLLPVRKWGRYILIPKTQSYGNNAGRDKLSLVVANDS